MSSGLRTLGQRGLVAAAASRGYSTIVGVPLAEQDDYIRKIAWKVMNAIPEGEQIRDHWPFDALSRKHVPGAEDDVELETAWLDQNPKEFLENHKVTADDFKWDPRKIHLEISSNCEEYMAHNPEPQLLAQAGITGVQYRNDVADEDYINWDFYAKRFPDVDIPELKKIYGQLSEENKAQQARVVAENDKMCERLKDVFAWAMTDHQKEAKKILAEVEATEKRIQMVNQAGFDLETQTYEDFCEENPDFVEELDIQLIEGNWCVEEEDLPKDVSVSSQDWSINYPMKSKEENNEFWLEFNKRLDAAIYGGPV
jgi:hypothetical protein